MHGTHSLTARQGSRIPTPEQAARLPATDFCLLVDGVRAEILAGATPYAPTAAERLNRKRHAKDVQRRYVKAWKAVNGSVSPLERRDKGEDLPWLGGGRPDPRPPRRTLRRAAIAAPTSPVDAPAVGRGHAREANPTEEPPAWKLRLPDEESFAAAVSTEAGAPGVVGRSRRRRYLSLTPRPGETAAAFERRLAGLGRDFAAEIVPDFAYQLEFDPLDSSGFGADDPSAPSLEDVRRSIGLTRRDGGDGVVIAVVDTGIDGSRPEFGTGRRDTGYASPDLQGGAWVDNHGHGTMCGVIAGGSQADGGVFDGIAPQARILPCRFPRFLDGQLTPLFEETLLQRVESGEKLVVTCSFGWKTGTPPSDRAIQWTQLPEAIEALVDAGAIVVFSGGNNHGYTGAGPHAAAPNTIWRFKSREMLMAVAACELDGTVWDFSSRGPGEDYRKAGTNRKPDVIAPVPRNGRVPFGADILTLTNGWGTSGAAPQVAGLAALIWSASPELTPGEVCAVIRDTAQSLGYPWTIQGAGRIAPTAALDAVGASS